MTKIIDGKKIAEKIKDEVVKDVEKLCEATKMTTRRPNLAIILVGDREDSCLYVDMKEREAKKVGIDTHVYRCEVDTTEKEILDMINYLNKDEEMDAILVQLPLPDNFDTDKIIRAIDPEKDVDRFHPDNLNIVLSTCNHDQVMPPVFEVVLEMLEDIKKEIKDSKVCIVSNSDIFGNSLAKVLECKGGSVTVVSPDDNNLKDKSSQADILITAVGKAKFLTKDYIKKEATVIDVGIKKEGKKVFGDVDFESADGQAGYITPVPGGVGPMTIAMLFRNTVKLFKNRNKK